MPAFLVADPEYQNQLGQADQNPRHGARHKQRAYRSAGNHGIHDHGRGGRDNHAHGGGSYGNTRRCGGRIALFFHRRNQDTAKGRRIRHGRAGDSAEYHGSHDIDLSQAAVERAQQLKAEIDNPLCDSAGIHQFARQHKQRHGDHQLAVRAVPDSLGNHADEMGGVGRDICNAGSADCKCQRHAQSCEENQQH